MNKATLYINNSRVPVVEDIAIALSFLISDIQYPDKRNSSFSKTIYLPGVGEIDRLFEFCFEVNISLQSFNPNLKTPVSYRINNTEVINGSLQLSRIRRNKRTGRVIYECKIIGNFADLFYQIGDKFLTGNYDSADDLDFSEYDHVINYTNVTNTFDPAVSPNTNKVNGVDTAVVEGIGYRYPLIDYGLNNGDLDTFYCYHLRPGLFVYEYLVKIFEAAGKTFTSNFLTSSFFKKFMIPCVDPVQVPASDIANRSAVVGTTFGLTVASHNMINTGGPGFTWFGGSAGDNVVYDDDSTAPFYDVGNIYNTTNGEFTLAAKSDYYLKTNTSITITLTWSGGAVGTVDSYSATLAIHIDTWNGSAWVHSGSSAPLNLSGSGSGVGLLTTQLETYTNGVFNSGTRFRVSIESSLTNVLARDGGGAQITSGTLAYEVSVNANVYELTESYFSCQLASTDVFEGDTLEMNRVIPTRIKQRDFLKGVINMFNLFLDIDKNDPNNYLIEPRDEFYNDEVVDWTDKEDTTEDVQIIPAGEIAFKRLYLNYKYDNDYYNNLYQERYQRSYGYNSFESQNQFIAEERSIDLPFSATPLVGNAVNGLIIPKIYKNTGSAITQQKSNIRILIWSGMIDQGGFFSPWTLASQLTSNGVFTSYPYAGHLDDPYNPTFDLCFGVPYEVFYEIRGGTFSYPTDNIFTRYTLNMCNEMDHKDSKVVITRMKLDEIDIRNLDFRKKYLVDGSYYRLMAVTDFDLLNNSSTEVKLIKQLNGNS